MWVENRWWDREKKHFVWRWINVRLQFGFSTKWIDQITFRMKNKSNNNNEEQEKYLPFAKCVVNKTDIQLYRVYDCRVHSGAVLAQMLVSLLLILCWTRFFRVVTLFYIFLNCHSDKKIDHESSHTLFSHVNRLSVQMYARTILFLLLFFIHAKKM